MGNRKRAGSIQQHFCFHWTAKRDGSLRNRPKAIRYNGNIVLELFYKRAVQQNIAKIGVNFQCSLLHK